MHTSATHPAVMRLIERQMRNWEIAKSQQGTSPRPPEAPVADFICLSYAVGTPGPLVGEQLAAKLGWPFFDREVLAEMAEDDDIRQRLYEELDEHDLTWFEETMRAMDFDGLSRNDYFPRLTATILKLARKGPAIFLGRASDLILPRECGLRARLSAPREWRLAQLADEHRVNPHEAERLMTELEADRRNFVRHHFHIDPADASRFDIVLNAAVFNMEQAIEMLLAAKTLKEARRVQEQRG